MNELTNEIVKEAQFRLQTQLTEEELRELQAIRYEINAGIKWQPLIAKLFSQLLQTVEEAVYTEANSNPAPISRLLPNEQDFLEGKQDKGVKARLFQDWLLLQLAKKTVGALKTRLNQNLEPIQTLPLEEEEGLRETVEAGEALQLLEGGPEVRRFIDDLSGGQEEVIPTELHRPDKTSQTDCPHLQRRYTYSSGSEEKTVRCRDCKTLLATEKLSPSKQKRACSHPSATWVKGREGKVAQCSESSCGEVVSNPEIYKWSSAGLEPYGDDPGLDQVIILDKVMP